MIHSDRVRTRGLEDEDLSVGTEATVFVKLGLDENKAVVVGPSGSEAISLFPLEQWLAIRIGFACRPSHLTPTKILSTFDLVRKRRPSQGKCGV